MVKCDNMEKKIKVLLIRLPLSLWHELDKVCGPQTLTKGRLCRAAIRHAIRGNCEEVKREIAAEKYARVLRRPEPL